MVVLVYLMLLSTSVLYCNCQTTTLTPVDPDVVEGSDINFVCTVSSAVNYVNWELDAGALNSSTTSMGVQNGRCAISPPVSILYDATKYSYTCNSTVYQLTVKNVQRNQHDNVWTCTPINQPSGPTLTINVQVPVSSVSITPSSTTVDVKENVAQEFICQTSASRPDASVTWYKVESGGTPQLNQNITSSTTNDDFSVTTSTLRFVPSKEQNGTQIYCKAENTVNTSPIQSGRRTLNVLYRAGNPVIAEGDEYRVIENNQGQLSCTVSGGNPTPTLSWNCSSLSPTESNSSNNGGITKTWTAVRGSDTTCSCTSQQNGFSDRVDSVNVVVLYPPTSPQFKVNGNLINGDIKFIVGKTRSIQCVSDSKPPPGSYNWTGPKTNDGQNITFSTVQKGHNGQYTCEVKNTMNPSTGGNTPGSSSSSVNLVVLYPPSMLSLYYGSPSGTLISERSINVVKGDTINIGCKSNDGEPEPTIRWNGQDEDNPLLTVQQVQESLTSKTCTATNTMRETGGNVETGSVSDTISFNVLIPPTIGGCTFYYINKSNNVIAVTETLKIIEHESFTLECSSAGKPTPSFSWTLPSTATTKSVTINEVTRDKRGNYVFYASSTLRPSYQDARDITVNKSITVEVLFPPMVTDMITISQLVGTRLEFDCPYTVGFPTETTFKWSRNVDSRTWNTRKLSIPNVTKRDNGTYQCNVSNTMQPSGDSKSYTGSDAKSFYFNVLYKASITSFTIDGFTENVVTVNESYPTPFICTVDSNPSAVITLKNHTGIVKYVTSEKLEHSIEATCLDAGTYICSARNTHNGEDVPKSTRQLFVNCLPRSAETVIQNRTSEKGQTYTITFNAIAYPIPNFVWWKFVGRTWTQLEPNDKHVIKSSGLQTNLTIRNLTLEDFTSYKLVAENIIGDIEETYILEQYDVPDPPTDVRHVEALTTTSTIHITWKPGNNGGLLQTFHIKYKKSSSSAWNYIDVTDTGDKIMNYSITGLTEKTQYDIVIYASNEKGNSSKSNVYTALTKEKVESPPIPGPLIGGVVGGVAVVGVAAFVVIFIVRRKGIFTGKKTDDTELRRRSISDDSDEEDGLRDNPMYVSSGNVNGASASEDVYAKPNKPKKEKPQNVGDIYAVVDKSKKNDNAEKKGEASKHEATGDVYENVGDLSKNGSNTNANAKKLKKPKVPEKKKNVNKDGLIYADLDFKDLPNDRKNIIIGDESTPYAQVDFAKKADPLPDSDDENA